MRPNTCSCSVSRRQSLLRLLGLGGVLGFGPTACAVWPKALTPQLYARANDGRWRASDRQALLADLRGAAFVLLGERHDNVAHHLARGLLIADLAQSGGGGLTVLAEHVPSGRVVAAGKAALIDRLTQAGFDAKGWQWPLHEPLFAAVDAAQLAVLGANATREDARQVARQGEAALHPQWQSALAAAPLPPPALATLQADLLASHCGELAPERMAGMVWAQRARDAAMALAMLHAPGAQRVLLAGNGHVRNDYGVPVILQALAPQARTVSVGLLELGEPLEGQPYDWLWVHAPAERSDPCEAMAKR